MSASNFGTLVSAPASQSTQCRSSSNAEAKVRKWVTEGFTSHIPPDLVLNNTNNHKYKTRTQVRRLASLLARHSFFGERTLSLCSVTGKVGNCLDHVKLASIKKLIAELLPTLGPTEFEEVWATCTESIRDLCKGLRHKLKQYNLLELACKYEGVSLPMD